MFTQGMLQFKQSYATLKTQEQKSTEGERCHSGGGEEGLSSDNLFVVWSGTEDGVLSGWCFWLLL